jgi:hypothetical protein
MPSPSPQLIESLVARVGEVEAMRWLGEWSMALLEGRRPPIRARGSADRPASRGHPLAAWSAVRPRGAGGYGRCWP